jgi:hypothetical protein
VPVRLTASNRFPLVGIHLLDRGRRPRDARVVHEHVDAPESAGGSVDERLDRFETSQTVAVMAVLRPVISFTAPPGRNRMFVIAPGLEAVPGTDRLKQTRTAE